MNLNPVCFFLYYFSWRFYWTWVNSSQTLKRLSGTPCFMTNRSHILLIQKVLKRHCWIKSHYFCNDRIKVWLRISHDLNVSLKPVQHTNIFCVVCRNIHWKKWFKKMFKIFNEFVIICSSTIRTWLFQTHSPETLVQSRRLLPSQVQVHVTIIILLFKTFPSHWLSDKPDSLN